MESWTLEFVIRYFCSFIAYLLFNFFLLNSILLNEFYLILFYNSPFSSILPCNLFFYPTLLCFILYSTILSYSLVCYHVLFYSFLFSCILSYFSASDVLISPISKYVSTNIEMVHPQTFLKLMDNTILFINNTGWDR